MIIGNGLLANSFDMYRTRDDVTIFASGVSNSLEERSKEFYREHNLLLKSLTSFCNSLFIYFGTCSIYDPSVTESYYIRHKLKMEQVITDSGVPYLIFRLPQVVGKSDNYNTLTNYLFLKISHDHHFNVWKNAIRHLVDVEDVVRYVSYIIDDEKLSSNTINFFTAPCYVLDIVYIFENMLKKKANYSLIEKGVSYSIPVFNAPSPEGAGISLEDSYLEKILNKYYSFYV